MNGTEKTVRCRRSNNDRRYRSAIDLLKVRPFVSSMPAGYAGRRFVCMASCILVLAAFLISGAVMVMANDKPSAAEASGDRYYTSIDIESGDTLWDIAVRYAEDGTDITGYINDIRKINRLSDDNITQGQHLIIYYFKDESR